MKFLSLETCFDYRARW